MLEGVPSVAGKSRFWLEKKRTTIIHEKRKYKVERPALEYHYLAAATGA